MTVLNVLLVDDSEPRITSLDSALRDRLTIGTYRLLWARSMQEGLAVLLADAVDLLIVDLVLPLASQDAHPAKDGGIQLIRLACNHEIVPTAPRIVGITAYELVRGDHLSEFEHLCQVCIPAPLGTGDWSLRVAAEAQRLASTDRPASFHRSAAVVLTAQYESEFEQLLKAGEKVFGATALPANGADFWKTLGGTPGDNSSWVVSAHCAEMGVGAMTALAVNAVHLFAPRHLIMTGICAGVKGKAAFGDVVIAELVWDAVAGRISSTGAANRFDPAPSQFRTDFRTLSAFRQLSRGELLDEMLVNPGGQKPRIVFGPVATVGQVIASTVRVDELVSQHRKVVGLEMEGYGLYAGANGVAEGPVPLPVLVKGVSDFANSKKNKRHREDAAFNGALVALRGVQQLTRTTSSLDT